MKTAMQKLISTFHLYQNSGCSLEEHELLSFYIKYAEDLIEKEKEQIADAFRNGSTSSMLGGGHWTQYYNQKYN